MILLDTNVVSELMRSAPAPSVLDWFAGKDPEDLYLAAIVEAELRFGVLLLPDGRRKRDLGDVLEAMLTQDFRDRILPFDSAAARAYAQIASDRRRDGRPVKEADCQIAAIVASRGAALATRNVKDFLGAGIDMLDPWKAPPS